MGGGLLSGALCPGLRQATAAPAQHGIETAQHGIEAAQHTRSSVEPARRSRVFVLTFGPGTHLFARFGHNALWFQDEQQGTDLVINFGTIPSSPNLVADFLKGRMKYSVSVATLEETLHFYRRNDQDILVQELDLEPSQQQWLERAVRTHALPENRWYLYDYYLDNCSTKVRDLIDQALGGLLHHTQTEPALMSRREHTLRLTWPSPISLAITAGLGPLADAPQTRWDEMFLPEVLAETLARVRLPQGQPLVKRQFTLHQSSRQPPPAHAPVTGPALGLAGVLGGGALFGLGVGARRSSRRFTRALCGIALWVFAAVAGVIAGSVGTLLAHFWAATDHVIAHANHNLLVLSPVALALTVLAAVAARSSRAVVAAQRVATILAAQAGIGLLLKALPWYRHDNWEFLGFAVPLWLGLVFGFSALAHAPTGAPIRRASPPCRPPGCRAKGRSP